MRRHYESHLVLDKMGREAMIGCRIQAERHAAANHTAAEGVLPEKQVGFTTPLDLTAHQCGTHQKKKQNKTRPNKQHCNKYANKR